MKRTIVTGGSTGLGFAVAKHLASLGKPLILLSRNEERLARAREQLQEAFNVEVDILSCNLRHHEELTLKVDQLLQDHAVEALVNNSAANFICPTERLSANGFRAIFDVVAVGTFYLTQQLGQYWIKNEIGGNVVSISASYAPGAGPFVVPSAMGKAAIESMTRSLAVEWAKYGIRLNAISPGLIPTPGSIKQLIPDPRQVDAIKDQIPQGRFGEPEEVAKLVEMLLCDTVKHLTGEVIRLDGGFYHASGAGPFYSHLKELPDTVWDFLKSKGKGRE